MRNRLIRVLLCGALLTSLVILGGVGCASSGKKRPKRTVLLTSADDVRAGAEAAKQVEASIGLLDNPELTAYVEGIGKKLLRGLPRRDFAYSFAIVDQMEPNAFALPGGHVYVSRGLLALVNDEDELACVMGHEIVHVAKRHSAQQQAVARYQGFSLPRSRAATLAAYGRDMEREADSLGQRLCAAAGYNPMGMSTFMRSLDERDRLLIGRPRAPTFADTHPGSRERAAANSMRASELRWTRDPRLGDVKVRYLNRIDKMLIGDRPETGLFVGQLFLHPVLDFEMDFPKGWRLQNSSRAVGTTGWTWSAAKQPSRRSNPGAGPATCRFRDFQPSKLINWKARSTIRRGVRSRADHRSPRGARHRNRFPPNRTVRSRIARRNDRREHADRKTLVSCHLYLAPS